MRLRHGGSRSRHWTHRTSFSVLCGKYIYCTAWSPSQSNATSFRDFSSSPLLLCTSGFPSCMLGERVQDAPSPKWANRHAGLPEKDGKRILKHEENSERVVEGRGEQMGGGVTTCVGCLCGMNVTSILQNSGRSIKLATHLDHTGSYSRYKIFSFWKVLNFTCHSIYFKMIKKQLLYHSHSTRYHVLWIPHPRSQVWKSH